MGLIKYEDISIQEAIHKFGNGTDLDDNPDLTIELERDGSGKETWSVVEAGKTDSGRFVVRVFRYDGSRMTVVIDGDYPVSYRIG